MKTQYTHAYAGGGAKGAGLIGTQHGFRVLGMQPEHLIGTSIGGINSFFAALYYDRFEEYIDLLQEQDFKQLVNGNFVGLHGDAKPLEAQMVTSMRTIYYDKLFNIDEAIVTSQLSEKEVERFTALQGQIMQAYSDQTDPHITFADHALIKKVIPDFPDLTVVAIRDNTNEDYVFSSVEQTAALKRWIDDKLNSFELAPIFKKDFNKLTEDETSTVQRIYKLNTLCTKQAYKELQEDFNFSAVPSEEHRRQLQSIQQHYQANSEYRFTTENLKAIKEIDPIKTFCRHSNGEIYLDINMVDAVIASGSLPIVLKRRKINGIAFKDGGLHNNMPSDLAPDQTNCLLVSFDYKELHKMMDTNEEIPLAPFYRLLARLFYLLGWSQDRPQTLTRVQNKDFKKVTEAVAAGKGVVMQSLSVETTDFKAAKEQQKELFLRFFFNTMVDWKINHTNPLGEPIDIEHQASLQLLNFIFRILDNNKSINKKGSAYQKVMEYLYQTILYQDQDQKLCRTSLHEFPSTSEISQKLFEALEDNQKLTTFIRRAVTDRAETASFLTALNNCFNPKETTQVQEAKPGLKRYQTATPVKSKQTPGYDPKSKSYVEAYTLKKSSTYLEKITDTNLKKSKTMGTT